MGNYNISGKGILWLVVLSLSAILMRILPHPPNVSPMNAICLFSGMVLGLRFLAFIVPIAMLYFSDLLINNTIGRAFIETDSSVILWTDFMYWTYASYLLIIVFSAFLMRRALAKHVVLGALFSGLLFFLITNFGTWVAYDFYPKNAAGLLLAYESAIPFLRVSIIGDVVFALLLYFAYNFVLVGKLSLYPIFHKA